MSELGTAVSPEELEAMKNQMVSEDTVDDLAAITDEVIQELREDEPPELTPEEQEAATVEAQRLLDEDDDIAVTAQAMITARQVYWMGRIALQRYLGKLTKVPGVEQVMAMNIATHGDQQRFTSQQVMQALNVILGFVGREAELDLELLRAMEHHRRKAEEENNGLPWVLTPQLAVHRSTSVIALPNDKTSWEPLAKEILERIAAGNDKKGNRKANVLHITDRLKGDVLVPRAEMGTKHYVDVGINTATASANSAKNFSKTVTPLLKRFYKERVDLILIDDILPLRNATNTWQSAVKLAEEAHRVIRKWADEQGCAVVACLPLMKDERKEHAETLEHLGQFVRLIEVPLLEVAEDVECNAAAEGCAVAAPADGGGSDAE